MAWRLQLMFTLVAVGAFYRARLDDYAGMHYIFNILYALAQIVPVYYWTKLYGVEISLFPGVRTINCVGIAAHSALVVWDIAAVPAKLYCRKVWGD